METKHEDETVDIEVYPTSNDVIDDITSRRSMVPQLMTSGLMILPPVTSWFSD